MQRDPIFDDLDYRLSTVKRWGTMRSIQCQSVAEHCHNVARISFRIAAVWFGIEDPGTLLAVTQYALHHDDIEAVMGDMPTMVKPYFDDTKMDTDYFHLFGNDAYPPDAVKGIVKIADKMDAFYYLMMERALGNDYVTDHAQREQQIVLDKAGLILGQEYMAEFDGPQIMNLLSDWLQNNMKPRSKRISFRGA